VIDIANTTTTLATGNITADTYFRAIVFNGYCDVPTAPVGITIKKANYISGSWDITPDPRTTAIIWTTFSSTADVSACNFILKSGVAAVFNINHTLTVQNEIDTSAAGASLTFENNSSLYQVNDIANPNSGNIIYKRNSTQMKVYDFTYWSSPVVNQNLYNFSPNTLFDKYFFWDTLPSFYNWRVILNGTASMQRGQGYIIRSPLQLGNAADVFNGIFTGAPNNGSFTKTIEVSNAGVNNLNLLGNPYPSAMNADVFFDVNTTAVYNSLYLWTHNTAVGTFVNFQYSSNDFATYNYAGGVGTLPATNLGVNNGLPNGKIAAGQAFFVRAKNTGSVVFNNTMRVSGNNNQFFRSHNSINTIEKNRLWLEISNSNGAFSQLLFGYIQNATDAKDDGFDTNLFNETPTVSFYSILNNEKMTIKADALPFDENKTNQLGFISKIDSDYEIKLAITDGLFDNQNVYLQDNLLNVVHNLKQSNYNFHSAIGTFNNRFLLRFSNNNLSNNQNIVNQSEIQVFKQNNDILVQSSNNKIASILIFDLNGRLLHEKENIDNDRYIINNLLLNNQMILIKTITADGLTITNKIVF
ncbi:MAG: T9SS sorting signal type C domain-containing protein, partial [Flavobacterium sp.]|nr:T9SS sorting signal type C domain-containing protein [Flavobacterium sp.]